MKRVYFLTIAILSLLNASAASFDQQADSAYTAENYPLAISLYKEAAATEGVSSTLYYNLGNAYYKNGELANAVLSFERSLRLDPTNEDAKANLEFVNSKLIDKQIDEDSLTTKIGKKVTNSASADHWAIITLIAFVAFLCTVAGYLFLQGVFVRKFSFFAALVFLGCTILGCIISFKAAKQITTRTQAIVTAPAVQLSTSPREPRNKTEEAVLLHEGTKLHIIDSIRIATDTVSPKWYEVEFRQGQRAWINAKDMEQI